MVNPDIKKRAIELRMLGESYEGISRELGMCIAKSTLWYWFKDLELPERFTKMMAAESIENLRRARNMRRINQLARRKSQSEKIMKENADLKDLLQQPRVDKLVLATLYWAEGSKRMSSIAFGNSDARMIALFLQLLRSCYRLDE